MLAGICRCGRRRCARIPASGLATTRDDSPTAISRASRPSPGRPTDFSKPEQFELMQGGAGTSRKRVEPGRLLAILGQHHLRGRGHVQARQRLFRKVWVSAPSSTQASDGLGPLFNARACQSCHLKDGRGHPPEGASRRHLDVPAAGAAGRDGRGEGGRCRPQRCSTFPTRSMAGNCRTLPCRACRRRQDGDQLRRAAGDARATARSFRCASRAIRVTGLAYGPLDPRTTLSPRVTPPMIGLGLVEQIHPADILAHADPDDRDGDGISGKASIVRDTKTRRADARPLRLEGLGAVDPPADGRCLRRRHRHLDAGSAAALGRLHRGGSRLPRHAERRAGAARRRSRRRDPIMDLVTFYSQNLAVPARRDIGKPDVLAGKKLFYERGCVSCHTPKFVTRRDAPNKAQSFQLIWPYSDFLLHDMGDGLADGQQVGDATGTEWRTPPLWGIGLTKTVNGHTFFLHDGRARNLTEAILWHGGEAEKGARRLCRAAQSGSRRADQIPGVAVMRRLAAASRHAAVCRAASRLPSADEKATDIIERPIDGFVRPAYAAFADATEALAEAVKTLCATPSRPISSRRATDFAATVDAWSTSRSSASGRSPSRTAWSACCSGRTARASACKQVQAALAAKDTTAADPAQAGRQERRHAGPRRARVRALRHRRGGA